ncbi:MAG: hypothetical protein P8X39_07265, partial [Desulfofustis sp.]
FHRHLKCLIDTKQTQAQNSGSRKYVGFSQFISLNHQLRTSAESKEDRVLQIVAALQNPVLSSISDDIFNDV